MIAKCKWLIVICIHVMSCTQVDKPGLIDPVNTAEQAPASKLGSKLTKDQERKRAEITKQKCIPLRVQQPPPFLLSAAQLVVTRIAKACETETGSPGFEQDTSWMAMGFPCTGGGGVLEYRENFHNPKIVSFQIPNSCPLKPETKDQVQKLGKEIIGFHQAAQLLAYYPMAVQYWELVDFPDADVGYVVDLRSTKSREEGWKMFSQKKAPLKVRLYGRENAWVKDNRFYQADVQLNFLGRDKFQVVLVNAKALGTDEIKEVQKRCEALRPQRNCAEVFF